jgi:hypothetical protein
MPTFESSGYTNLITTVGRAAAHTLFQNDIEHYMLAFELVNSQGDTIDYLAFPVMPKNISRVKQEITVIKKSFGGITALSSQGFIPINFTISGNFGRKLRLLIGNDNLTFAALRYSTRNGVYTKNQVQPEGASKKPQAFLPEVKTGYGVTKILQSIIEKSNLVDNDNKPLRLYFYNPSFGESYMIKASSIKFEQDASSSNMMWDYDFNFTAIAPLNEIESGTKKDLAEDLSIESLSKAVNIYAADIRRFL